MALEVIMDSRCKHNWTTPPECPQCCAEERDRLAAKIALLRLITPQPPTAITYEQGVKIVDTVQRLCWD